MAYSVFSTGGLAQVVRAGDSRRFGIDLKNDRSDIIAAVSANALAGTIALDDFRSTTLRRRTLVSYRGYEQALILRSIARHLKQRLKVQMPDRNRAVRGVITSLLDCTPMFVIRCDIKSFYESVLVEDLREKLLHDTASSTLVRSYFERYFAAHCSNTQYGLPRGAGLSAVLAEISIRPFDDRVRTIPGVYRYFRYADDIVVFCLNDPASVLQTMRAALPRGMHFNRSKTKIVDLTAPAVEGEAPARPYKSFNFLGYELKVEDESGRNRSRRLIVTIADNKVKRIQTKMILSFKSFMRDRDVNLLVDRLRFISSNYKVKRSGQTHNKGSIHIKSGIYYNYALCGSYKIGRRSDLSRSSQGMECLKKLDGLLRGLLSVNSDFGTVVKASMSLVQQEQIRRISFSQGFQKKMLFRVTPDRVSQIKRAWRNA